MKSWSPGSQVPVALTGVYKNMNRVIDALHEHAPAAIRQHDGTQLL